MAWAGCVVGPEDGVHRRLPWIARARPDLLAGVLCVFCGCGVRRTGGSHGSASVQVNRHLQQPSGRLRACAEPVRYSGVSRGSEQPRALSCLPAIPDLSRRALPCQHGVAALLRVGRPAHQDGLQARPRRALHFRSACSVVASMLQLLLFVAGDDELLAHLNAQAAPTPSLTVPAPAPAAC